MYLTLNYTFNNIKYQFGVVPGKDIATEVNNGVHIYLDPSGFNQFLDVTGTLTSDRYPQSDVIKPISFYLNPKILVLSGTISGGSDIAIDEACQLISQAVGEIITFNVYKYVETGNEFKTTVFRFDGVINSIKRTIAGRFDYDYIMNIEMIEPRFEKLEFDGSGNIIPKTYTHNPINWGVSFPVVFPIQFGSLIDQWFYNGEAVTFIINNGNTPVTPNVVYTGKADSLTIQTPNGKFNFTLPMVDGQVLILDIFNQKAVLNNSDLSAYASGWESLTLNCGQNIWIVNAINFSNLSLLTVTFFEKFHSL